MPAPPAFFGETIGPWRLATSPQSLTRKTPQTLPKSNFMKRKLNAAIRRWLKSHRHADWLRLQRLAA